MKDIGMIFRNDDNKFEWRIPNFFSYTEVEEGISSSYIGHKTLGGYCFQVLPNGETSTSSRGFVSFYLCLNPKVSPRRHVSVCYSIGIRKANGTVEQRSTNITCVFEAGTTRHGIPKFLEVSELQRRKSELVPSSALTLLFTFETLNDRVANLERMARNFTDLFTSKRNCDVMLVVKGREFPVHKAILSARSSVFATMFGLEMQMVEILDCDPSAFELFLQGIYTGIWDVSSDNARELFKIANKYGVEDLADLAKTFLG